MSAMGPFGWILMESTLQQIDALISWPLCDLDNLLRVLGFHPPPLENLFRGSLTVLHQRAFFFTLTPPCLCIPDQHTVTSMRIVYATYMSQYYENFHH